MIEHPLVYFGSVSVQLQRHGENQEGFVTESDRSDEEKVIDQLEMAQLDGNLVKDVRKAQQIVLRLSRHGVQIMSTDKTLSYRRIALLNLLFSVAFEDGFGKFNCAIVENCFGDTGQYKAHVFQAENRNQSNQITLDVDDLFKQVEEHCEDLQSPQIE